MPPVDPDAYAARSRALDLSAIAWDDVPRHPLSPDVLRTLRYMQDIESHTIVYLRTLLSTRAMDDPEVATFLACWFYEETFHGRALARFLAAAGHPVTPRPRSRESFFQWAEARAPGRGARGALPRRPLLGAGGEPRAARRGGALPHALPHDRRAGPVGRPPRRRPDPQAPRLRRRAAPGSLRRARARGVRGGPR